MSARQLQRYGEPKPPFKRAGIVLYVFKNPLFEQKHGCQPASTQINPSMTCGAASDIHFFDIFSSESLQLTLLKPDICTLWVQKCFV